MSNSSEHEFENAWKQQFENAAIEPDEKVWAKIDAELAHNKADIYKKRALFFKLLAAASLLFALGVGYYNFYYSRPATIASGTPGNDQAISPAVVQSSAQPDSIKNSTNDLKNGTTSADTGITQNSTSGKVIKSEESVRDISTYLANTAVQITETRKPDISILSRKNLPAGEPPYRPKYPGFKGMDFFNPVISSKNQGIKEMWAGIDMASGMFNPNITYGSRATRLDFGFASADANSSAPSVNGSSYLDPETPDYNAEISYSYGINMGARIADKWVLTGGFGYQNSKSSTTVNKYIESGDKTARLAFQSNGIDLYSMDGINTLNTANTKIDYDSYFEFLSIPVSAGYIILDNKFKWIVNGGISTEIFLKNSLSDPDHFLNEVEIYPGRDSPYNSMLFSGVLGTSIYLPFLKNYQAVLYPSYKFGLNYLTRENSSFNSKPSSLMVNAGVSYIFK